MFRCQRYLLSALVLFFIPLLCSCQRVTYNTTAQNKGQYRVLINRSDKTGVFSGDFNHASNASDSAKATLNRTFTGNDVGVEVFSVDSQQLTPAELCASLKESNEDVTSCEPDFLVSIDVGSATPDDTSYSKQWNMPDIQMATAWKTGQFGSQKVRTCVIDTGIDFTHPDLIANLWMNPKEMNGPGANAANGYQNGIDDDGNGIIDDIYGANFVEGAKDGNVQDQNGHGTFVAGVVGAVGNNNLGVTGVNQIASIITCRFMDATGNGWVSDAIRCMDYCMTFDSHILQNSWGGVAYSDSLQTAVTQASTRGVLAVCSAGNDGQNTDTTAHYPSSLPDDIIFSVGASTANDTLWNRSNFGVKTVAIMAPGVQVYSTGLGGLYIYLSGTSMATPHVSGVAALMLAQYAANGFNISTVAPNKGLALDLKKLIMSAADKVSGAQVASGHLNAGAAMALIPLAQAATTESFGGNAPPGGVGQIEAYNPTMTGSAEPFGGGGPGGIGGNALVSTDSNATNATDAIAPSSGFNQTTGPAIAPPVPSAVAAQAAQFQQFASQFGRRLQSQNPQEGTREEKAEPIRLPLDHSNIGSHTSAMAREADALRRSVVAANQAAAAGMDVGGVAAMERHAELLQEEVRQSEARLRDMLSQGHPIA